jgi:hypothetical protein
MVLSMKFDTVITVAVWLKIHLVCSMGRPNLNVFLVEKQSKSIGQIQSWI